MNKRYLAIFLIVIILIGGYLYYLRTTDVRTTTTPEPLPAAFTQQTAIPATATSTSFGTYTYECDEHVTFTMTPASDMTSIAIAPTGNGTFPKAGMLTKKPATSGVRYEGNGTVLTAKGETVTLDEGDSAINCSPVQNPDSAPFNFGD